MLWLFTGKQGAGKTQLMITEALYLSGMLKRPNLFTYIKNLFDRDKELKLKTPKRPVYQYGIDEIKIDEWRSITKSELNVWWKHCDPGSILLVDEAQFPFYKHKEITNEDGEKEPEPKYSMLTKNRHHGIDIFMATQDPSFIDKWVVKNCTKHFHLYRPMDVSIPTLSVWYTGQVSPDTDTAQKKAINSQYKYDKRIWKLYQSAEIHTHKFRPPKYLFYLIIALIAGFYGVYNAFSVFGGRFINDEPTSAQGQKKPGQKNHNKGTPESVPLDHEEYLAQYVPRIKNLPYTAPIYDELTKPTKVPVPACFSLGPKEGQCTCYVDSQPFPTDNAFCQGVAKFGIWVPFDAEPKQEQSQTAQAQPSTNGPINPFAERVN
jgi:zona occludens toxin